MPIRHLTPAPVWQWFADICTIPHPTYREAELAAHIVQRAEAKGLTARLDEKAMSICINPPSAQEWNIKPG